MDFPNEQKDDNYSDKIVTPLNQCVLKFLCSHCGINFDTFAHVGQTISNNFMNNNANITNDDICPSCKHKLSKCSVCLCSIKLSNKSNNECLVFCNKCSHGGHYEHYKDWFKEFNECPNSKCDCRCQQEEIKSN